MDPRVDDRREYIGASEVAGLLPHDEPGRVLHPYTNPRLLYARKRGEIGEEPSSFLMAVGNILEPHVIAHARREGLLPPGTEQGPPLGEPSMRRGYLGAHPDLISADGPIDVKVVSRTSAAWDGAVPAHYVAQLAAQLACLGASEGRAAILSCHLAHGAELRLAWIEISAGWVTAVAESAEAFMEGYVYPGIMPPAWRSAARGVAYPLDAAASVRPASQREQAIIARLRELSGTTTEIEDLRAELAESLADTPAIVGDDGRRLATYRPEKRTTLDRSAIPADVLSAATTTTEARVLRLARSKE